MQYNIYFRKDNWERFKDEENKSGLINALLKVHYTDLKDIVNGKAYARGHAADMASRALPEIKKMDKELSTNQKAEFLGAAYTAGDKAYNGLCKHGADPKFCKFAKPGKPCKGKKGN